MWCEELIKKEFNESCNFDVDDAVHKLEQLGIVSRVRLPTVYSLIKLECAVSGYLIFNKIINMLLTSF